MPAQDLVGAVSLDSFRARIPGCNSSFGIEHEDCIIPGTFHQQAKPFFAAAKGRLRLFAVCNIPNNRQERLIVAPFDGAEQDVDGKLSSIFPPPIEFEAGPHGTRAGRGGINTALLRMMTAKSFRHENFYEAPDQLCLGVAEESFHSRIGRGDMTIDGRYDNSIRGC